MVRLVRRRIATDEEDENFVMETQVYTLGDESWRSISNAPKFEYEFVTEFPGFTNGVFLNGLFHWVAHHKCGSYRSYKIVSFDFESNKFDFAPLGPSSRPKFTAMLNKVIVGVLGGCLFLNDSEFGKWVMKDYNVQESLTQLIPCTHNMYLFLPVKYLNNWKILVNCMNKGLRWCEPAKDPADCFGVLSIPRIQRLMQTIAHVPSFFSFKDLVR